MNRSKRPPLISVCIPVFETEPFLDRCLKSVAEQKASFPRFEVILVNDASSGTDENGHGCKKAVRRLKHKYKLKIHYIEHSVNRGLVETRRTAVTASNADYIAMLDSDDLLVPGALAAMYEAAVSSGADIVHGHSVAGSFRDTQFIPYKENIHGAIHYGTLEGRDIFRQWFVYGRYTATSWGKLIRRDLFLSAFQEIPYTECNMAEDMLIYFFIALKAQKYIGIETDVYHYIVNTGMSSQRKILTLDHWRKICSTASVFTILFTWNEEHKVFTQVPAANAAAAADAAANAPAYKYPLYKDELLELQNRARFFAGNNILQMNQAVAPELIPEARAMLCDFWGEKLVTETEAKIDADLKRSQPALTPFL